MPILFTDLEFLTESKLNAAFAEERAARIAAGAGAFAFDPAAYGGAGALHTTGNVQIDGALYSKAAGAGDVTIKPLSQAGPYVANSAQLNSTYEMTGTSGSELVVSNGRFYGSVSGSPGAASLWNLLSTAAYNGTGGNGSIVPIYGQGIRAAWNAGGAANNPEMWAGCFEFRDTTGQPSSATNHNLSMEIDLLANGLDDADKRQMLVLALGKHNPAGADMQANVGLRITGFDNNSSFKKMITLDLKFSEAGLDTRFATKLSGHTIWLGTGNDIAFDTAGANTIYHDAAVFSGAGATRFSGKAQFDGGDVYFPSAFVTIGNALNIGANRGLIFLNQTSAAAAATGTLTNAPNAGNPTFWIPVWINGAHYTIPAWSAP